MNYKAVIFDLDGTLLNTLEDLADSMNMVLKSKGFPIHNVEKYRYFIGNGVYNLVKSALPAQIQDEDIINEYFSEFGQEYNKRLIEKTRPYPGIPELLDELERRGIKMSILSNKPDQATQHIVSKLLSKWKFDAIFGERPGVPRKPDPKASLEICSLLNVNPQDFIYLGDSGVDMQTANSAGIYGVGALWGFRDEAELKECGAKITIDSPVKLLNIL